MSNKAESPTGVPVQRIVRPDIATRYRMRALVASWRSSALWKRHDAEMCDDESEKMACRREAQAFEECAGHIEQAVRDWPNAGTQRPGTPDGSLATETRKPGSLK